jgi:predicted acetylornithine/succinylornithine family transaminase
MSSRLDVPVADSLEPAPVVAYEPFDPLGAAATEELDRLAPLYPLPRVELVSGRGTRVTDARGHQYLDFVSGIAVLALGHAPPGLAQAVSRQMKQLTHCSNLFANRPAIELARLLIETTGYDRVFFCNSGTEGVEAALKFARVRARTKGLEGRDVLAFRGGFHGRTAFALSVTWNPPYRAPFEPLMPGIRFADLNDVAGLDAALDAKVAAVIVEPVQGEGGAVPATREFLVALRERCTAIGAALIFDEIQCGMGRSGRLLAAEHFGVRADLTVLSKALGGGLPLGAVLLTEDAARGLEPGMHGCTFGGGPAVAAAGLHVLERVRRPGFLTRVRSQGKRLAQGLAAIVTRHPALAEARGLGLLQAVVLAPDATFEPAALVAAARAHGLLLVRGGERAIRFLPPLNVSAVEIDEALERFERALGWLETQHPEKGESR